MSRKRKAPKAGKVEAPRRGLAGERTELADTLMHLRMTALRLELMRQGMSLGVQTVQFLEALKPVFDLGPRVQGLVQRINTMPDADVQRLLAEIAKARVFMDEVCRLAGAASEREAAPQSEAVGVPGGSLVQ